MKKNNHFWNTLLSIIATACIGLGAGISAWGFQILAGWIFQSGIEVSSNFSFWTFAPLAFLLTVGGALIAGFIMSKYAPEAAGSGIPQVKKAYAKGQFDFSWNLLWVKFFAGSLSIGTGSSLGREGPTIHIGAAIASKIASFFKESEEAKANAVCAGSAAGLAAAFNSPLAGVTLVLEEISEGHGLDKYAGRSLFASAIAVCVIFLLTGNKAALPLPEDLPLKWEVLWLAPVVALFTSCFGVFFQWATLSLRERFKLSNFPLWMRPGMGAIASVCFCLLAFAFTSRLGAFGLGEIDLLHVLNNQLIWQSAAWLLAAKLFATIFSYGSGGCGGIFAPLIFMGGMAGAVVFGLTHSVFDLDPFDQTLLSMIGMTAALGSVVRAPLTSIIIVFEMTRQIQVLPALMIASVISVFINTLFFRDNFYQSSLSVK